MNCPLWQDSRSIAGLWCAMPGPGPSMPDSAGGVTYGGGRMMLFKDREHAARLLAQRLAGYRGQGPLVLGIPRGAIPMAKIIAEALDGELDVVLVHKLAAPGQPELAIGSVDEAGHL